MGKTDIDSAFRLIPIHPNNHSLLGFKFGSEFYYDSCLPFGASSSCSIFEAFSSALEWVARYKYNIEHIVHILDDFLFDPPQNNQCNAKLWAFLHMCSELGVPIKHEKTENMQQLVSHLWVWNLTPPTWRQDCPKTSF